MRNNISKNINYFDLLPPEIIKKILINAPLSLRLVSRAFNDIIYDDNRDRLNEAKQIVIACAIEDRATYHYTITCFLMFSGLASSAPLQLSLFTDLCFRTRQDELPDDGFGLDSLMCLNQLGPKAYDLEKPLHLSCLTEQEINSRLDSAAEKKAMVIILGLNLAFLAIVAPVLNECIKMIDHYFYPRFLSVKDIQHLRKN